METAELSPRAALKRDVAALIGLLAVLEGEVAVEPGGNEVPEWARPLARRLSVDGLLPPDVNRRQLRQGLNDLNHRLRYVLGEYDEPVVQEPVT